MKARLGCFGNCTDVQSIAKAGYDCAELDMLEVMALRDDEFEHEKQRILASGIACDVYDTMLPLTAVISSTDFQFQEWAKFQHAAARKTADLGAKYWIFGNSKARSIPTTGDVEGGRRRVMDFLKTIFDAAGEHGITVLIEPLPQKLTNHINYISQAVEFINDFGAPNLGVCVDIRHMVATGEPFSEIEKYGQYIMHAHIDNPLNEARYFPRIDDGFDYSPYLSALENIDYSGIIAAEARYYLTGEARKEFAKEATKTIDFFAAHNIPGNRSSARNTPTPG